MRNIAHDDERVIIVILRRIIAHDIKNIVHDDEDDVQQNFWNIMLALRFFVVYCNISRLVCRNTLT